MNSVADPLWTTFELMDQTVAAPASMSDMKPSKKAGILPEPLMAGAPANQEGLRPQIRRDLCGFVSGVVELDRVRPLEVHKESV